MLASDLTNAPAGPARRWLALAVLCTGALMSVLDGSIVTVALPALQRDLGLSQSELPWIVNAYLIALGGLLLFAGRLGDLVGKSRVFIAGLVVFTSASTICGVSSHKGVLIAARFVQGAGGAMTTAVILGMVVTLFPEPRERAKAIGVYSFVQAVGGTIGLLGGGLIVEALSPRAVFFVNVPLGVVAVIAALRVLARKRVVGAVKHADIAGALLVTSSLMLTVYTIIASGDRAGGSAARTAIFGVLALVLFAAFLVRQATAAHPLVVLAIFRSRPLSAGNAVFGLLVGAMFGFQFLGALHLQRVLGYGAAKTGASLSPIAIGIAVFSLGLSARFGARFGARRVLAGGLGLVALGLALFARESPPTSYVLGVLPSMMLLGAGAGLAIPSAMTIVMSAAPERDAGLASGILNTTQQVGGALGLAGLAALATSHTDRLLAEGHGAIYALHGGYRVAFGGGVCLAIAAIAVATTLLRPHAKEPA